MSKRESSKPKPEKMLFTFKEIVEALLKYKGIKTGVWGLYVEFGLGAANAIGPQKQLNPTAIIPITNLGVQPFASVNDLSVDAKSIRATTSRAKPSRTKPNVKKRAPKT